MARILVADDELLIAMAITDWLTDLGHQVVGPASTLEHALELCEEAIHAAILDVSLGDRTSVEVARRLSARGVPFAVVTGHDIHSLDPVFATGLPLPKPFGFVVFRRAMERLIA